jgi:hypothetical protein
MVSNDKDNITDDSQSFDHSDYDAGKWRSVKEMKVVEKVRTRFEEMKQARRSNCPFPSPDDIIDVSEYDYSTFKNAGYSWEDRWQTDWNLYTMKHHYIKGRSNIKSATSFSPIEAAMAEFQTSNLDVVLTPTEYDDEPKLEIIKSVRKLLHSKGDFKTAQIGAFHDALVYGSSFEHITHIKKVRDVEKIISDSSNVEAEIKKIMDGTDEATKEKLKKRLEKGKPLTKKERIVEYDDVARIHVSIFECYVDPDARCMKGHSYEATDFTWRTLPSLSQFKSEFENSTDPYVIKENIKRVKGAEAAASSYEGSNPLFTVPTDLGTKSNNVEVLRYYNKRTDKYIIIANDILIRNGPLPFNHKQIPFVLHKFVVLEHSFYGLGLPYFLEGLQSTDEATRNMMIETMWYNLNPAIAVNRDIFNDAEEGMEYIEPGKVIDFSGPVGNDSIRMLEGSAPRFDYFQLRNVLKEEEVRTSGINPITFSVPDPGEAVRNNLMAQESTQKMLRKGIFNYGVGEKEAARQEISLMCQIYPEKFLKETTDDGVKKFKSIRIDGIKLTPIYENDDENARLVEIQKQETGKPEYFELRDDYFKLLGEIEIEIDVASFPLVSPSLRLSKVQEAITALLPFWQNPVLLQAPGANELIKSYINLLSPDYKDKILEQFRETSNSNNVEEANMQTELLLKGEIIPGQLGESDEHKLVHISASIDLISKLNDPSIDPNTKASIQYILGNIYQHLITDDTPKQAGMSVAQPPMPPQMSQPPQMPQNGRPMSPDVAMPGQGVPEEYQQLGMQSQMPQIQ